MKNTYLRCLLLLIALPHQTVFAFDDDAHPIVPGFERFAESEEITDQERGMLLINELNCQSCHASDSQSTWSVAPKQAPVLTQVGARTISEYFQGFVSDPQGVKPGTTMPDLLSGKSAEERNVISESIAHFLASTGEPAQQNSSGSMIRQGERLFHSIGCVACHDPQNENVSIATSVPLGQLDLKYSLPGLIRFLENPLHTRPSGRMPQFNLTTDETQSIAAYLLRDAVVESKLNFAYYEGDWKQLPDFSQIEPISTGITAGFDVHVGRRENQFGVVFTGFWETKKGARYLFRISSDDGSQLEIDGVTVAVNDGIHARETVEQEIELPAGIHQVRVEFFENQGGEELQVEVTGGGHQGVGLESLMRATRQETTQPNDLEFELDPAKAAIGKTHFQSLGCASCHELKVDGQTIASTLSSPPALADVATDKGCLSGRSGPFPAFHLSERQRHCLSLAVASLRKTPSNPPSPEQRIHQKLLTLNCYACHSREMTDRSIRGGVVDMRGDSLEIYGRKKWFTGKQVEMGDEGQHPPALKAIGAKLKRQWLDHVLNDGADERPYMLTRMPKFGVDNLANLADDFVAFDQLEDVPQVVHSQPLRKIKAHGRFLAGDQALSCIKCHNFGKYPGTGVQSMDLTTMTKRLNRDWFQVYMLKPSRFRRGTRMPESWPGGKSYYPDILDGDTQKQIDSLWEFLADGENAAKPKGLVRSKMELKAVDVPKVYRNFIEGAGARAIGVGYPEQVNVAFDAELCRLALVWQENFIDASRHWTGRGQGFEPPLGENVLPLPDSVVFVTNLDSGRWPSADPAAKPRFKGYRFDTQRRPIFTYQLKDVVIEDQPIPVVEGDRPLLKRKFRITATNTPRLFYLAAEGKTVNVNENKAEIDGRLQTRFNVTNHEQTGIIQTEDRDGKLIVEIDLTQGPVEIEQFYDW